MEHTNIEKDFVARTLHILEAYDGPYGVTLLINCLLGLVVLPKERNYKGLDKRNGIQFSDLGVCNNDVISWGNVSANQKTAARFIRCIRNAVAHIKIESISEEGEIEALRFSDESGFDAVLGIDTVKEMVKRLADYINE